MVQSRLMVGSSYENLVAEKRAWYKSLHSVHCPLLNMEIQFNSKSFNHLLYDGLGHARSRKERMYRINLLPFAPLVLKHASQVEEYRSPVYSKPLGKSVEFWSLKTVVGNQKTCVTVVLRRIGTGNVTFHSIWKKKVKSKPTKKPSVK
jgi:hypothetical protein